MPKLKHIFVGWLRDDWMRVRKLDSNDDANLIRMYFCSAPRTIYLALGMKAIAESEFSALYRWISMWVARGSECR